MVPSSRRSLASGPQTSPPAPPTFRNGSGARRRLPAAADPVDHRPAFQQKRIHPVTTSAIKPTTDSVSGLLQDIAIIGRDKTRGGYSRPVFSTAETELRDWFLEQAGRRGLDVHTDRNGIIWAWWDTSARTRRDAVVTGSHLDSVPGGGEYDG